MYKVLLVDDENRITRGLQQIIPWKQLNCIVAGTAYNGEAGLKLAEEIKPDIMITDINMPYMDGLEMIAALKKNHHTTKFIILSGYSDFKYAQRGIQIGIQNYVLKPVDEIELENSIKEVIKDIEQERYNKDQLANMHPPLYASHLQERHQTGVIKDIQDYMVEHYASNLTLISIADAFFINPSYLSQLFMKKTNTTFLQYLTNIRIKKAEELLKKTDLKVYEISSQVGYKDSKYFSKMFERTIGAKPVDYRNQN
ncbi:response regulator transcription factor [Paenibacillus nasutitermitis]|uniref:DNA-binding response regulator n=1 Tax=Paenibacillus nasutitermitis TaxID=1652958 RepID=A0A916Z9N9_9BACL|nr:response regulator [Paenibacillus nasutitermitis]GGD82729.1 DNA-binding response regulator [Paenibacillus nasutitermitis]